MAVLDKEEIPGKEKNRLLAARQLSGNTAYAVYRSIPSCELNAVGRARDINHVSMAGNLTTCTYSQPLLGILLKFYSTCQMNSMQLH